MMPIHPNLDALLAWRDGEREQADLEEHLRECAQCRSTLFEARLLRLLMQPAYEKTELMRSKESHLDEQLLAAYYDQSLPLLEANRAEQHLSRCDSCLSTLLELRAALAPDAREPLSATAFHNAVHVLLAGRSHAPTLRGALALFARGAEVVTRVIPLGGAGKPAVSSGAVFGAARSRLLDVVDEALRLVRFPAGAPESWDMSFDAEPASGRAAQIAPSSPEYLPMKPSPVDGGPRGHLARSVLAFREEVERALEPSLGESMKSLRDVSAASLQRWLAAEAPELPPPKRLADFVALMMSEEDGALHARSDGEAGPAATPPPAALTADFGPTRLQVVAGHDSVGVRLRIKARDSLTGVPKVALRLRLSEEAGDTVSAATDEAGEVVFLLKPGFVRLSQEDRPDMQILLLFVDAPSSL